MKHLLMAIATGFSDVSDVSFNEEMELAFSILFSSCLDE